MTPTVGMSVPSRYRHQQPPTRKTTAITLGNRYRQRTDTPTGCLLQTRGGDVSRNGIPSWPTPNRRFGRFAAPLGAGSIGSSFFDLSVMCGERVLDVHTGQAAHDPGPPLPSGDGLKREKPLFSADRNSATAPVIVIDSREQLPYTFGGRVETVRLGLETGDYSLLGHESTIVVERKSLPDYVQSLTAGRARFLRECERLQAMPIRAIVVEGSFDDIVNARYDSLATPQSIIGSTIKLITDYGLPVVLAGCRAYAERFVERFLTRHHEKAVKAVKERSNA